MCILGTTTVGKVNKLCHIGAGLMYVLLKPDCLFSEPIDLIAIKSISEPHDSVL